MAMRRSTSFAITAFILLHLATPAPAEHLWERVVTDGFHGEENYSTGSMAVFGGRLYVPTANAAPLHSQVWRSEDGVGWEAVEKYSFGVRVRRRALLRNRLTEDH